ncbi:MAG TPA: M23 family metallopeptidase [Steroidobacteraceae bacterium]|jgi:murein DD-endopeptidase MepM/ murein hydrolase activator NlpD
MRWPSRALTAAIALLLAVAGGATCAQALYKYRDVSGAWVYTDRTPPAGTSVQTVTVDLESKAPRLTVEQNVDGGQINVVAVNECACEAEFALRGIVAGNVRLPPRNGDGYRAVLPPHSRKALLSAPFLGASPDGFSYAWRAVLGRPGAEHRPPAPYRAPFALGSTFRVNQAYPSRFTHIARDSEYAVDIGLPDGTPVYAARDGIIVNVRHDNFRGAPDPAMYDQANVVQILHDDGTIAVYAHLHWQSIRVQPGQSVRRGEYIANSGNTGLTTGPHLHFAVIRNAGMKAESVPIEFAGPAGSAITPQTGMMLTAY